MRCICIQNTRERSKYRFVSFSSKKAYRFPITTIDVSFYSYYSLFSLYSKSYGSTYCIVFVSFRFLPKKRIVFVLSLSFGFTHIIYYFFSLLLATYFLLFLLSCGAKLRKYCFVLFHWFFFVLSLSCFILLIYFFYFHYILAPPKDNQWTSLYCDHSQGDGNWPFAWASDHPDDWCDFMVSTVRQNNEDHYELTPEINFNDTP